MKEDKIIILALYKDKEQLFKIPFRKLIELEEGKIFCLRKCGVLDLNLNKTIQGKNGKKLLQKVFQCMDKMALSDIWRLQNPIKTHYVRL